MEAEPLGHEEGEILDDEPVDVFDTYNILQRPHTVPATEKQVKMRYSDDSDDSEDSESDSDSDSARARTKKPKLKVKRAKDASTNWGPRHDKYKIWCTQVQEESLTEDLVSCGVTKKLYQERSVESYNFTLHYSLDSYQRHNNNSSDDERDNERKFTNKRRYSDRQNPKPRKRRNSMDVDGQKGAVRIIADLSTTADSTDADVATEIADKLNEKQADIISRIIRIIGKQLAIDFYQRTKKIEEGGGLLTMNGSRRRTAGGIYFWLIKNDEHIPQEKIREIFFTQKKAAEQQKKAEARRQKSQEMMRSFENDSEKDLPALLTRAELSTRQIAEEARLRRGVGMDRMPVDSERTVTNPPPSPVTDDPDHSEHPIVQRQVQDYADQDDFLDIGVDIDSMEVF